MQDTSARRCPCQGGTLVRFLQPIILSALSEEPCHGYILLKKISQTRLWQDEVPNPTGLYRTLRDMEARGLIASHVDGQSRAGDRKVFSLTEEGMACRQSWLKTLRQYQRDLNEVIDALASFEGPNEE